MELPIDIGVFGMASPVILRMLSKRSDWGAPEDDIAKRVDNTVDNGFLKRHSTPFSFYRAETAEDIRRVVMALAGPRYEPGGVIDFVAFRPEELEAAAISVVSTPGTTQCAFANIRHLDGDATRDQLLDLCRAAMNHGRMAVRFTKQQMKEVIRLAHEEHCQAESRTGQSCTVVECPSTPGEVAAPTTEQTPEV